MVPTARRIPLPEGAKCVDGGNVSWSDQAALPGIGELMPLDPCPRSPGQ